MYQSAAELMAASWSWPEAIVIIGAMFVFIFLVGVGLSSFFEFRKTKLGAQQDQDLRQLVRRFEHLAENTLDAQQRMAADVAELRTRTASIEQILRTVE